MDPPAAPPGLEEEKRRLLRGPDGTGGPMPSNVDWFRRTRPEGSVRPVLRKPTRTLSGVAVVAVMTAPAPCPHGRCTYCPGGVEFGSPQSYTGEEPSALRGAQFGWDARAIVTHRIEALESIGHPTSKVEAIVMGGTFPARPAAYRERTFRGIYEGLNGRASAGLADAQAENERADRRLVGLTVETRPDWCQGAVLRELLDAGVTRIEIGVECLDDRVLADVGRAHAAGDVERATRTARDHGLKVGYHMMLGLPGMDPEADEAGFRRLFEDPEYRPDFLKIYPTLVLPGTALHADWAAGRYRPYDTETAVDLLARVKARVPPWVRIHRIQRDIPVRLVSAGVRAANVRQLALARLARDGRRCDCLRCREAGRRASPPAETFVPIERVYRAGGGEERFLSFEDPASGAVAGFLRLRFPSGGPGARAPIVRELKVLGAEVAVGRTARRDGEYQHRGFGSALLARAEAIAADAGAPRILVLSAVGTREYYRRRGYGAEPPWMSKPICA